MCDRWDDPRVWREYFLHGACALLGGHAGMILADYRGTEHCFGRLMPVALVGLPEAARQQFIRPHVAEWENRPRAEAPGMQPLLDELARHKWVTASRDELTDEATYHASIDYLNVRKPLDLDDFILSIRFVDLGSRTVHDYVTALYQHFRVSSRAELLAYFIRRQPVPRAAAAQLG